MNFTFAIAFNEAKAPKGLDLWRMINEGPGILRPTSVNSREPLRRVETVDIETICQGYFIWRNGRKCLGMFRPRGWKGKATLGILLQYAEEHHQQITTEIYEFIKANLDNRLLYGVAPSRELMDKNLDVHRFANCGSIPPDESVITDNRNLYEFFDEAA